MTIDRRTLLAAGGAIAAAPALARAGASRSFPKGFLWGAATAGHQVEGNDTASDAWLLEHVKPTTFAEPAGDACDSFDLWAKDLDLVKMLGLNSYRFSLEWSRIEPEPGEWSIAMLDHYKRIVDGCRARGLTPIVTYCHFTTPRWFAAQGGWTNREAPRLFAAFCERATRHLGAGIGRAVTINEPDLPRLIHYFDLPPQAYAGQHAMLAAAARAAGTAKFNMINLTEPDDWPTVLRVTLEAHRAARAAIKSVRPDLPVGVSLAIEDEVALPGGTAKRDAVRSDVYGAWLDAARDDDFVGVQNYSRRVWNASGRVPPSRPGPRNWMGIDIVPGSLAGAVRYAHAACGRPVLVTEHGLGLGPEEDDRLRAQFIPAALNDLHAAMDDGVPVHGYIHWSLLDNFEWGSGYKPRFGLVQVDRTTFRRTPKPSAAVLGAIARRNAV